MVRKTLLFSVSLCLCGERSRYAVYLEPFLQTLPAVLGRLFTIAGPVVGVEGVWGVGIGVYEKGSIIRS